MILSTEAIYSIHNKISRANLLKESKVIPAPDDRYKCILEIHSYA